MTCRQHYVMQSLTRINSGDGSSNAMLAFDRLSGASGHLSSTVYCDRTAHLSSKKSIFLSYILQVSH